MAYVCDAPKKMTPPPKAKPVSPFKKGQGPTTMYERALRNVAREVGKLVKGYMEPDPLNPDVAQSLSQALKSYADILGPWALNLVNNIIGSVDNQDKYAWRQHSKNMSVALRKELDSAPIGDVVKMLFEQNIKLIKSIPIQAAERVHSLVQENMMQSARADEIAKRIMETESVTKSRATLIARTEVSKASVALTQARALSIGSDGYLWRTSGDLIVRKSHRKMANKFVRWDSPPSPEALIGEKSSLGTYHAGGCPNCRCWPEPIIPEI